MISEKLDFQIKLSCSEIALKQLQTGNQICLMIHVLWVSIANHSSIA